MAFSALYLLPAVALLILFQGSLVTIKGNLLYRSRRFQNRVRARAFFFRGLVVALFVATAITKAVPLADLNPLIQGLLITVALMIPVGLYSLVCRLRADSYRQQIKGAEDDSQERDTDARIPEVPVNKSTSSSGNAIGNAIDETPVAEPTPTARSAATRAAATSLHNQSGSSTEESELDQTLSVSEQLETLDELVHFHDIGDEDYLQQSDDTSTGASSDPAVPLFNPLEKAIAIAREGMLEEPGVQDPARENLPARSSTELAEMVVRLRSDKMKLQKLVIAQKAVIDAEKQAHDRTRVVVKDAISVMRHARHGQRIAEKIARRERSERQRLEKDFDKVRQQLDNALSTIKAKNYSEPEEA